MPAELTYRHISAIRAIMMTGSVTGAAVKLHVTQPAISHLINDIEEILRFPLFDRRFGRLVPTRRAELLFEEIERSFVGLDSINDFCHRLLNAEQRTIQIAAVPVIATAVLPSVIREHRAKETSTFFVVRTPPNEQVVAWVGSQKADLGIALETVSIPGLKSEVLGRFRAMCLLPPGHRLADADLVTSADLRDEPMIATTRENGVLEVIVNAFRAVGGAPNPVVECPAATAACAMVEAGIGFTLLDPVAAYPFRNSSIIFKRFEPALPFVFCAYWLESRRLGQEHAEFIDLARAQITTIGSLFPDATP